MRIWLLALSLALGLSTNISWTARSWAQSQQPSVDPAIQASPSPEARLEPPPRPAPKPGEERVKIYSDKAIYKRQQKRARAIGHVKILQDNTTIYADEVLYHEDTKQSFVEDGVKIVQINKKKEKGRKTEITAVKMTAFHGEKRIILEEAVRMDRAPYEHTPPANYTENEDEQRERAETAIKKARSVVTSDRMEYFTESENANLDGTVVMLQKDKKITGDKARIRGEEYGDLMVVEGNAQVTQINGEWLLRNKVIKPDPDDEEQERFIKEKLIIDADKITFYRATDDLKAEGNVKITQKVGDKQRVAVGKEATFSDSKQVATLVGDVKVLRENGDWMLAERALFFTDTETFEATGTADEQVVSEFTFDEDDDRNSKEPINPALDPFDLDAHQPGQRLPSWLKNRQTPNRAPAKPAPPQSATPTPPSIPPSIPPKPAPTAAPSAAPAAPVSPTPRPTPPASPPPSATPQSTPTPVASSFRIETGE